MEATYEATVEIHPHAQSVHLHVTFFIYARKIYVRTHIKITQKWKSSFTRDLSCVALF